MFGRGVSERLPENLNGRIDLVALPHRTVADGCKVIAAAYFILITVWMCIYEGGIMWDEHHVFNIHPFSMALGPVMMGSWGMTSYRSIPTRKSIQKTIHAFLNIGAVGLAAVGLAAVITDKMTHGEQHFKSMHSWIGLVTLTLFTIQFFIGLITFVVKPVSVQYRDYIRPYHSGLGVWSIICAALASALGIMETMADDIQQNATDKNAQQLVYQGFIHFIPVAAGLLLVFLIGGILYTIMEPRASLDILVRGTENLDELLKTNLTTADVITLPNIASSTPKHHSPQSLYNTNNTVLDVDTDADQYSAAVAAGHGAGGGAADTAPTSPSNSNHHVADTNSNVSHYHYGNRY